MVLIRYHAEVVECLAKLRISVALEKINVML